MTGLIIKLKDQLWASVRSILGFDTITSRLAVHHSSFAPAAPLAEVKIIIPAATPALFEFAPATAATPAATAFMPPAPALTDEVPAEACTRDTLDSGADATTEPVTIEPVQAPVLPKRRLMMAARLRSVGKLNKRVKRPAAARKAAAGNAKTHRPVKDKGHALKRSQPVFPVKRQKTVAKRAQTRITTYVKQRPTAVILKFPTRAPHLAAPRLKRAA